MHFYTLYGQVLSVVEEAKYLGLLISDDLSWSHHISSITGKATATLGFLRRNLRKCPAQLKEPAYIAFERLTLDYVSPLHGTPSSNLYPQSIVYVSTLPNLRRHYDLCPVDSCVNLLSALDSRNGVMSMRTSPHLRALLINNNPCGQQFS